MLMNPLLAASLFDNPWLVAVIVVAGALINWLSQRRQAKAEAEEPSETEAPPTRPKSPQFDPEEVLRRLLGGEPQKRPTPPPPLPRSLSPGPPQDEDWSEETESKPTRTWVDKARQEARQAAAPTPPPLPPPPRPSPPRAILHKPAARVMRSGAAQRVAATSVERRTRSGSRRGWNWRDRRSAQRAFVASLVFGSPKGLES